MKRLFLLLLVTVSLSATAQFRPYRDVVYLNDGSVIKGKIHFEEPDSTLFVDTPYGCTFAFTKDKVQRYELKTKETFQREKGVVLNPSFSLGFYGEGFSGLTSLTDGANTDYSIGLLYRTGDWYELGLEWSYNRLHLLESIDFWAIQFTQRLFFSRNPISPFLDLKIGYSAGKKATLPESYESYYWYEPQNGYINRNYMGEVGIGVSLKNVNLAVCAKISPYCYYYGEIEEYYQNGAVYYLTHYKKKNFFIFLIRIGYLFSLD